MEFWNIFLDLHLSTFTKYQVQEDLIILFWLTLDIENLFRGKGMDRCFVAFLYSSGYTVNKGCVMEPPSQSAKLFPVYKLKLLTWFHVYTCLC